MPQLVDPAVRYKDSFIAAIREFHLEGRYDDLMIAWLDDHFEAYVAGLIEKRHFAPQGKVKDTYKFLVEGDTYIGRVSIRHELSESLKQFGGHIGYDIRPSERRKGYGTLQLKLALAVARELGLTRVMLTCDSTNEGSRRIIQHNGGVFQDETQLDFRPVPTQRWWIDLT
ncbi:MAG: GNAT family N-acetyltransferase [Aggregatilineales bacterium]